MTNDERMLLGIVLLAVLAFALRASGFLLARWVTPASLAGRLLQKAPGNLFVAFIVMGIASGGVPVAVGVVAALLAAITIREDTVVLATGVAAVTLAALAGEWLF